ncbi:MAG TPA: 30S ribosomal protein S12 methylthiotransferase RimO [Spirochaetota bacterium]|nr:30S ribosomal protein S12 methylthiotransferase RimO [Spirochaetota bacterium]HPS85748.1 30S ribosomal protein S12 methylthiotransferase RimO [Spirochaetota bacterium]
MYISSNLSFYIISLGCSKNLVDSEKINGEMISAGFTPAEASDNSDIIIINTCGFIQSAKEEAIEVILDAVSIKESGSSGSKFFRHGKRETHPFARKVVVTGCLTKRYFNEIESEMPEIDFIYGIPDDKFVSQMCRTFDIQTGNVVAVRKKLYNSYPYSYIKISDGCSNNCSYCAIPLIRGPHVPFPPEKILKDAEAEVLGGALELNIIAQDIAVYQWGEMNLVSLINEISKIEKLRWIRLLYCHPDHITDEIINLIAENKKVVPYIDIPFQHVSKSVLKSMGREGDTEKYLELIARLRKKIPGITIRSTFMIGYPGAGEKEFHELLSFIKTAKLDKVGCFIYSPEEGTAASELPDTLSADDKNRRLDELMSIQADISREKLNEKIGIELDVLVEEKIDDNTYIGRTESDAPEVDGVFYLTAAENRVNQIVRARVTDSVEYDLIGVMI